MTTPLRKVAMTVGATALLAAASLPASAQSGTVDFSSLGLDPKTEAAIRALIDAPRGAPASTFGSPSGFGANWGTVFVGLGGNELPNASGDQDYDGGAVIGMGFGDANRGIGGQVSYSLISINEGFADDGAFSAKLHTRLPGRLGVAVGINNIAPHGRANAVDASVYASATKVFSLRPSNPSNPLSLVTTLGAGDNRDGDDFAGFGSVGLNLTRRVGIIADWPGSQLNLGVSVVPFRSQPMSVTLGLSNVTEENGGEATIGGSVGYSFNFNK